MCNVHSLACKTTQFSQHYLMKAPVFPYKIASVPLLSINWSLMYQFNSELSILYHWSICLVLCHCHTVLTIETL